MRPCVLVLGVFVALPALAQSADQLPAKLSGKWVAMSPRGAVVDFFSLEFDGNRGPGGVSGRLTWRGVNCGAKDEPIKATWDGSELVFEATVRPNVNAQRSNGQCHPGPTRFVLKRKPGEQNFEGEARNELAVVSMTASP